MKAMLLDTFPQDAFSTAYAMKDLSYALELARDVALMHQVHSLCRIALDRR